MLEDEGTPPSLREFVLTTVHERLAHAGAGITLSHLRRFFWWDKITKDTEDFCRSCESSTAGAAGISPFELSQGFLPPPFPFVSWGDSYGDRTVGAPIRFSAPHR